MKKWVLFKLNNSLGQLYSALGVKNVTDDNDLMIINQSGIVIRLAVADCRVMGRATQGVRLINLAKKSEEIENDTVYAKTAEEVAEAETELENKEDENVRE